MDILDFLFGKKALDAAAKTGDSTQTVTPAQDPTYLQKQVDAYMKQRQAAQAPAPAPKPVVKPAVKPRTVKAPGTPAVTPADVMKTPSKPARQMLQNDDD